MEDTMTATISMTPTYRITPSTRITIADLAIERLTQIAVEVAEGAVMGGAYDPQEETDEETIEGYIRVEALIVQWLDDDEIGAIHPDAEHLVRAEARRLGSRWVEDREMAALDAVGYWD